MPGETSTVGRDAFWQDIEVTIGLGSTLFSHYNDVKFKGMPWPRISNILGKTDHTITIIHSYCRGKG